MQRIGRYEILDELGRGAMGVVYRAQDPAIGRVVAIKTIRLSDVTEPAEREHLRQRLFHEARSAGVLSHPNIVTIYDFSEENGLAYVFMEFVNGPTLEHLLSQPGRPDRDSRLSILRQTAGALDYAHSKGIVHRDIKPGNIMLHEGLQAKVSDFGVAQTLSHQITHSGAMMGTPDYMSPEQVQGTPIDGRADQFSLAVVAYELLTGRKPFAGENLNDLLYNIVRETPAPPRAINASLAPETDAVFERALAKSPEQRFDSCLAFTRALEHALAASPGWRILAPVGVTTASIPTPFRDDGVESAPFKLLPPRNVASPITGRNILTSLVWLLVGVGLVGVTLLGLQTLINDREQEEPTLASASPAPPAAAAKPDFTKPSPVDEGNPVLSKPARVPAPVNERAAAPSLPAAPPPREAAPQITETGEPHTVQIVTDPAGAQITIDTGQNCKTPCMLDLGAGRHTLNARLAGYRAFPKVFNVPTDSDLFIPLSQSVATLSITSDPPGAIVQLNGVEQRRRTPLVLTVAPGSYHVRVSNQGVPLDFDVSLHDGEFITKTITF